MNSKFWRKEGICSTLTPGHHLQVAQVLLSFKKNYYYLHAMPKGVNIFAQYHMVKSGKSTTYQA